MTPTLFEIYSNVALDVNDITFSKLTKAEYLRMADAVATMIAQNVDVFVVKKEYTAVEEADSLVITPALGNAYFVDTTNPGTKTSLSVRHVKDEPFEPLHILKAIRRNQDMREVSWTAVESAIRGNAAFKVNDTQLDYRHYAVQLTPNDYTLWFVQKLEKDETITIWFTTRYPVMSREFLTGTVAGSTQTPHWAMFEDLTPVPWFMSATFYKGIRKEAIERLAMREGDVWVNRFMNAKNEYETELRALKKYVHNLKDRSSFPQIQPVKWLSENRDTDEYSGGNGIEPSWTTRTIIQ